MRSIFPRSTEITMVNGIQEQAEPIQKAVRRAKNLDLGFTFRIRRKQSKWKAIVRIGRKPWNATSNNSVFPITYESLW